MLLTCGILFIFSIELSYEYYYKPETAGDRLILPRPIVEESSRLNPSLKSPSVTGDNDPESYRQQAQHELQSPIMEKRPVANACRQRAIDAS